MRAHNKQERRAARLASSRCLLAIFADDARDYTRRRRAARLRRKTRTFQAHAYVAKFRK